MAKPITSNSVAEIEKFVAFGHSQSPGNCRVLLAEIRKLRTALRDITNPIGKIRRDAAEQGRVLSDLAYGISRDPSYLQGIAKNALGDKL